MQLTLERVYEKRSSSDGTRILVERLWPRGVSKKAAEIDLWLEKAAPSTELRQWFGHAPERWDEFKRRYFEELDGSSGVIEPLLEILAAGPVVFVYSSRETRFNSATALAEYLERALESRR